MSDQYGVVRSFSSPEREKAEAFTKYLNLLYGEDKKKPDFELRVGTSRPWSVVKLKRYCSYGGIKQVTRCFDAAWEVLKGGG